MTQKKLMKAAIVHSFGKPLVIEEVPKPTPGTGEIIDKNRDKRIMSYRYPRGPRRLAHQTETSPIPGHEGVGIVEEIGKDVTEVKEGDRVGIPWLAMRADTGEYCASGWENAVRETTQYGLLSRWRLRRIRKSIREVCRQGPAEC